MISAFLELEPFLAESREEVNLEDKFTLPQNSIVAADVGADSVEEARSHREQGNSIFPLTLSSLRHRDALVSEGKGSC